MDSKEPVDKYAKLRKAVSQPQSATRKVDLSDNSIGNSTKDAVVVRARTEESKDDIKH